MSSNAEDHNSYLSSRPGILDVARLAGVSSATVSRVINGSAVVSSGTREAVEHAIETLHYVPNKLARSLITRHSGVIGILIDRSIKLATANVLVQTEEVASSLGYMSVVSTVGKPFDRELVEAMKKMRSMSVEGVILISARAGIKVAAEKLVDRLPMVIISSFLHSEGVPVIGEDQQAGAYSATSYLADLGHKKIWHVAGSNDWFDGRVRVQGWRQALVDRGLVAEKDAELNRLKNSLGCRLIQSTWNPDLALSAISEFDVADLPDAIFAASDHIAMALIAGLTEKGVRVPEDLSIVGYDDMDNAMYVAPPLTTVRQNLSRVARRAVELLIDHIQGQAIPPVTSLKSELVIRGSAIPATEQSA